MRKLIWSNLKSLNSLERNSSHLPTFIPRGGGVRKYSILRFHYLASFSLNWINCNSYELEIWIQFVRNNTKNLTLTLIKVFSNSLLLLRHVWFLAFESLKGICMCIACLPIKFMSSIEMWDCICIYFILSVADVYLDTIM